MRPFDLKVYRRAAAAWLLLFISFSPISAAKLPKAPYSEPIISGNLENPAIREASGMVASHQNQGVFWILNDGGNGAYLFAVTASGRNVGEFNIAAAENIDWEDLALFYHAKTPYLLIADVGDNDAQRSDCVLYALVEPRISQSDSAKQHTLKITWQRRFRYEDGPRDCEAAAVDVAGQKILLLSKRDEPPVLYGLPLWPAAVGGIEIAHKITKISDIPPPTQADLHFKYGRYRSQPTAMDISPSGREVVVLTYKNAYSYEHLAGEDWKTTFSRPPAIVYLPLAEKSQLRQREALCFGADGQSLYVTSEGQFAPIYRIERNNH